MSVDWENAHGKPLRPLPPGATALRQSAGFLPVPKPPDQKPTKGGTLPSAGGNRAPIDAYEPGVHVASEGLSGFTIVDAEILSAAAVKALYDLQDIIRGKITDYLIGRLEDFVKSFLHLDKSELFGLLGQEADLLGYLTDLAVLQAAQQFFTGPDAALNKKALSTPGVTFYLTVNYPARYVPVTLPSIPAAVFTEGLSLAAPRAYVYWQRL